VRTKSRGTRYLYNYEELEAFEELQIDTKYLLDSNALPEIELDIWAHVCVDGGDVAQITQREEGDKDKGG